LLGFTIQIGDARYTTGRVGWAKSRATLLATLCAGRRDWVINEESLANGRGRNLVVLGLMKTAINVDVGFF
jgi:hypothetical protein